MAEALKKRLAVALACALVSAGVSALLLMQHHGETSAVQTVNAVCGDGKTSGCEQVARSSWSALGGVPLAALGLGFSAALAALCVVAMVSPPETRAGLAGLAVVLLGAALGVDVALGVIQAFLVKAFCGLCVATYVLNAVAFAALWPARQHLGDAVSRLLSADTRPGLVGLGLAALALVAGVVGFDQALVARAATRSATLLGSPMGAPGPGGNWEAEAHRLQAILDDPHQLEQYFNDKAAREFATSPVETFELGSTPSKGPADAPVKVVEFSDFLCPFCRQLAGGLSGFLPQAGGRVQIFYKNYPLEQSCNPNLQRTAHPGACLLALGGVCAQEQGKFWAYHDRVFARPMERATREDVNRFAGEGGLDPKTFATCMESPGTQARLAAEIAEAKKVTVQSTPTLFINGKKLPRMNDFLPVVDREAQAKGFPSLQSAAPPNH